MTINTETMKGKISFRGLGFILLNGMNVAICGSRQVDCGYGAEVKWIDGQLIKVPVEPEIRATYVASFDDAAGATGDPVFSVVGGPTLYLGRSEGLLLGADYGMTDFVVQPPLRASFLQVLPRVSLANDAFYPGIDSSGAGDIPYSLGVYINLVE